MDFEQLSDSLVQLEKKCKGSWDHLKVVAKHEAKASLKTKTTEFLKDCTERIIILKVVHRRIINRWEPPVTPPPPQLENAGHTSLSILETQRHSAKLRQDMTSLISQWGNILVTAANGNK